MKIWTRSRISRTAAVLLFCVVVPVSLYIHVDQLLGQDSKISLPFRGTQSISVIPSTSSIVLSPGSPADVDRLKGHHPFQGYARFDLNVQSVLPEWGTMLDVGAIEGPEGPVPTDRLWVRSKSMGKEFVQLKGPIPVVTGDYRLPVREEPVEVLFRPTWNDPAGIYRFQVALNPFNPVSGSSSSMSVGGPPEIHGRGGEIGGLYNNHEVVVISIEDTEIHFEIRPGPGIYQSDDDITFRIWTNAKTWRVDCEATSLTSDKKEIPLNRLLWERRDEYDRLIDAGNMASNPTILSGLGRVEELKTTLRFKVNITAADVAGSYNGNLSLVGYVGD